MFDSYQLFKRQIVIPLLMFMFVSLSIKATGTELEEIYDEIPDMETCNEGVLKDSVKQFILEQLNFVRATNGLRALEYKEANDIKAQKAAFVCSVNGTIPETINSGHYCYSDDAKEGRDSAVVFQTDIESDGEPYNTRYGLKSWLINDTDEKLSIRRLLMNPFIKYISFGRADAFIKNPGSVPKALTMVLKYSEFEAITGSDIEYVAYPYHDFPPLYMDNLWRLSFSVINDKSSWENCQVDFSNTSVSMEVEKSGTKVHTLSAGHNNEAYGAMPNIFYWKADGLTENIRYLVKINNVKVNGQTKNYEYWFNLTNTGDNQDYPAVPTLSYPENEASDIPLTFDFIWDKADRADWGYAIEVSKSLDFIDKTFDEEHKDTTLRVMDLEPNTTYYWRVASINGVGQSNWSEPFSFTTSDGTLPVPAAPVLTMPENNAVDQDLGFYFFWDASSYASSYNFQLSKQNDFSELTKNETIDVNMYEISGLAPNTTYYWRVKAKNSTGESAFSNAFNFKTKAVEPDQITLAYPEDNSENIPINPNLQWNADAGAQSYSLQVSLFNQFGPDYSDFIVIDEEELSGNSFQAPELSQNTNYYWRVKGVNDIGSGDWSDIWEFKTGTGLGVKEAENIAGHLYNIPNPLNESTVIHFYISEPGYVQLKLYNSLGIEIETLAEDYYTEGHYTVEFVNKNLSSGIYYYTLFQSGNRFTKAMEILK